MTHEIIIAGFGGQGVLLLGKILSHAAILDGKETTWISSYGVEMRGGTANCSVVISDQLIGSPFVSAPTAAVVLNTPAFEKFEPLIAPRGALIVNSSLVERSSFRSDIHECRVPCSDIALELGNAKSVNLIALGALLAMTGAVSRGAVSDALKQLFTNKSVSLSSLEQAVSRGHASAQKETVLMQPMLNCA